MTDGLPEWLRAQLDTDERIARAVPVDLGHEWSDPGPWIIAGPGGGGREAEVAKAADGLEMPLAEAVAHHIAAHDPARALREIEAKRAIVARYEFACREAAALNISEEEREVWVRVGGALQSCVLLLAAIYADRPGYDEAVRP